MRDREERGRHVVFDKMCVGVCVYCVCVCVCVCMFKAHSAEQSHLVLSLSIVVACFLQFVFMVVRDCDLLYCGVL